MNNPPSGIASLQLASETSVSTVRTLKKSGVSNQVLVSTTLLLELGELSLLQC